MGLIQLMLGANSDSNTSWSTSTPISMIFLQEPRTSNRCTIVSYRQPFLRPTTDVRGDMNRTEYQESR
jgi:hypothetical protein